MLFQIKNHDLVWDTVIDFIKNAPDGEYEIKKI